MQIDYETVQRWVQEKRNQDGYGVLPVDLYFYVAQRAADHVSAAKSADIPNQPGLNIDLTRMREAALHAQVHGVIFKADGSQVRQVLDHLHERVLEINRLNARIAELEAQQERKPLKPVHPPGLTSINARISFDNGWRHAERAHGIQEPKE